MEKKIYYLIAQEKSSTMHITECRVTPDGTFIPNKALCGTKATRILARYYTVGGSTSKQDFCPKCLQAMNRDEKKTKKIQGKTLTLAGHLFYLMNVSYGIHSEETTDFTADLFCDGKKIGYVENEGHGGPTSFYASLPWEKTNELLVVKNEIEKLPWLKCTNGTIFRQNFGVIADHLLIMEEFPTKYQTPYGNPLWIYKNLSKDNKREILVCEYPCSKDMVPKFTLPQETIEKGSKAIEESIQAYIQENFNLTTRCSTQNR